MPEEAYYWLYARHLAPGYLDHPPMVAWLIALGGALFGHNEFAVRIGALLAWSIAAVYLYRLATLLFDRSVAWLSVALLSILPIFAGIGFTITPDSPLMAAWMAALFYLHRAALGGRARAWYAFGIAVGLGMLSKYTIVLLAPTALLVVVLHPPARMWLRRREPYLAALIALGLFSPVLYWNANHDWASFAFQGPRRFAGRIRFSVFRYFRELVVVITPSGVAATAVALWGSRTGDEESGLPGGRPDRLFVLVAFLVPFVAFLLYSVRQKTKLNWAAPGFLVMLPCIAHQIVGFQVATASRFRRVLQRSWVPTLIGLGLLYAVVLYYVGVGLPGVGYSANFRRFVGWQSLGEQVVEIAQREERDHGAEPIIIGMDSHDLSSELSFYTLPQALRLRGSPETISGPHPFGRDSLMFRLWDPPATFAGHSMLLIAHDPSKLRDEVVVPYFDATDPLAEIAVTRHGKPVGTYFYRVGRDYHQPTR
jgi:dolichol-phosphate mannosyltransferase